MVNVSSPNAHAVGRIRTWPFSNSSPDPCNQGHKYMILRADDSAIYGRKVSSPAPFCPHARFLRSAKISPAVKPGSLASTHPLRAVQYSGDV